ncbi:MAG: hypothetical protein MR981_08860 [Ruminococcus bromii]|nr:hypothetical protein [Ruminococcus bromii]
MTYKNQNAAYDLSLFDDGYSAYNEGSAAPKYTEQESTGKQSKRKQRKANNVVKLPEEELHKIRRRKHNPVKLALGSLGATAVALTIGAIIVGQVQLTELNQEIITAQATLEDAQSIYTQNEMKIEANLSNEDIEKYATDVLGMTKASNTQKEFVSLSEGDKAEVFEQKDDNLFTQFIESIKNLWS